MGQTHYPADFLSFHEACLLATAVLACQLHRHRSRTFPGRRGILCTSELLFFFIVTGCTLIYTQCFTSHPHSPKPHC